MILVKQSNIFAGCMEYTTTRQTWRLPFVFVGILVFLLIHEIFTGTIYLYYVNWAEQWCSG